ncbi:hypothetical protein [Paraburkholderia atlantica]|uniref:hypothetical protein n=1 Tax=Paraburkholderia atlantica TaxID=2654982 RepID=UPI003D1C66F2
MKRFFRRLIIKNQIARHAAHLEAIQRERAMLDRTETFCVRQINELRVQQLNLDVRARRHA